jgi:hypothetical protein
MRWDTIWTSSARLDTKPNGRRACRQAPEARCDDTDLVKNLVTKQNAAHWGGVCQFVSCCFY